MNAITASLRPPSAGVVCSRGRLDRPGHAGARVLVGERDVVVLGAQRGQRGGQHVERLRAGVEPPVGGRRALVEVVGVHALERPVEGVVGARRRCEDQRRQDGGGRAEQRPCEEGPHPSAIGSRRTPDSVAPRVSGRLDWRPVRRLLLLLLLLAVVAPGEAAARDFPRDFLWGTAIAAFQTEAGGTPSHADRRSDWWAWSHDRENISDGSRQRRPRRARTGSLAPVPPGRTAGPRPARVERLPDLDRVEPAVPARHPRRARPARARPQGQQGGGPPLRRRAALHPGPRHAADGHAQPLHAAALAARPDRRAPARSPGSAPTTRCPPCSAAAGSTGAPWQEFGAFAGWAAWRYGSLVDLWVTVNEPMVVAVNGYVNVPGAFAGWFPPGVYSFPAAIRAVRNLADAERGSPTTPSTARTAGPGWGRCRT